MPKLSFEQQWALFSPKKYRNYTDLLVGQYAKLAKAKEQAGNNIPEDSEEQEKELE